MTPNMLLAACAVLFTTLTAGVADAVEFLTYKDKLGRTVKVKTPVERAVSFQTYEMIPALGLWDQIVGLGRYAYDNDLMKATRPDLKEKIPSVGAGIDLNFEMLFKLRPDLVMTWTIQPTAVKFMEEKGFQVVAVYPDSLKELYEVMELHGRLFGKESKVRDCISEMETIFDMVRRRRSSLGSAEKKKVLWVGGKPTNVACGDGLTNELIDMNGGVNAAGKLLGGNLEVSMEQILAWNPDVIFIWGHARYKPESILQSPQWRFVNAVKDGRVYKAPVWNTWSPRLALLALWMGRNIYPELFADVNLETTFDNFYRNVFGIPYEKVRSINE